MLFGPSIEILRFTASCTSILMYVKYETIIRRISRGAFAQKYLRLYKYKIMIIGWGVGHEFC